MTPIEAPTASPIIHYDTSNKPPVPQRPFTNPNPNLLSPNAAFYNQPPPVRQQGLDSDHFSQEDRDRVDGDTLSLGRGSRSRRRRRGARRGRGVWKKLLWVKQRDYPDNYTDPPTFLAHLQRNPRLRPYDFWPLVADSTVIVQHIASVAIFVCSFVAIYQQRVSPVSVVGWGSAGTVLGWVLWDIWMGQEASSKQVNDQNATTINANGGFMNGSALMTSTNSPTSTTAPTPSTQSTHSNSAIGLGLSLSSSHLSTNGHVKGHKHSHSQASISSGGPSPTLSHHPSHSILNEPTTYATPYTIPAPDRMHQRLSTAKSAILIYTALLGLSPILKSLTESTSKDSIWALSTWLMLLHIFFFDYGGSSSPSSSTSSAITKTSSTPGANSSSKFPASLSTNAALMASTVLASRLPSTTHVFSLTLFSIEVFGLFPVWRRCLRHLSWRGHLLLTFALVLGAGAGLGLVISGRKVWSEGGWKRAIGGAVVCMLGSAVGMGGCSWWLIGLQRYKNVVSGPWDPARPIIRGGGGVWD